MRRKERLLLNDDLKYIEEIQATLNEIANYFKKEIVRTRSDEKLVLMNKYYEKLIVSSGKLAVISKRWELYDYDKEDGTSN